MILYDSFLPSLAIEPVGLRLLQEMFLQTSSVLMDNCQFLLTECDVTRELLCRMPVILGHAHSLLRRHCELLRTDATLAPLAAAWRTDRWRWLNLLQYSIERELNFRHPVVLCEGRHEGGGVGGHEGAAAGVDGHEGGGVDGHEDGGVDGHEDGGVDGNEGGGIDGHDDGPEGGYERGGVDGHEGAHVDGHKDGVHNLHTAHNAHFTALDTNTCSADDGGDDETDNKDNVDALSLHDHQSHLLT